MADVNAQLPSIAPIFSDFTGFLIYGILLVLAIATGYFLWKKTNVRSPHPLKNQLKILENRMIGPKQSLMVIEYQNQKMLIGVSMQHIQPLFVLNASSKEFEACLNQAHTSSPSSA